MREAIVGLALWAALAWPVSGQVPPDRFSVCGRGVHLVVEGLADTSYVSADVALSSPLGRNATGVWGQHVRVLDSTTDLPRDTVVAVSWRHPPGMLSFRSEPFVAEGQRRFLSGAVRSNETSNDLPILDGDVAFPFGANADASRFIPLDSLLDFCRLTVDGALLNQGDWTAMETVHPWVRSSNHAWTRQPVALFLDGWARSLERERARALAVEVAGTWEAEIELPSGESVPFFFRTASRAIRPWYGGVGDARRPVPGAPWAFRAAGVQFRIWAALEMRHLPGPSGEPAVPCSSGTPWIKILGSPPTDPDCATGNVSVIVEPFDGETGAWQGRFPRAALTALHPRLAELDRPERLELEVWPDTTPGPAVDPPEFWSFTGDDPRSAFIQRIRLLHGEVVLTARRISSTAVAGS